jgi:hypothetical protein
MVGSVSAMYPDEAAFECWLRAPDPVTSFGSSVSWHGLKELDVTQRLFGHSFGQEPRHVLAAWMNARGLKLQQAQHGPFLC